MSSASLLLWVVLLNLGVLPSPPTLDIQILLGSPRPQSNLTDKSYVSSEVKNVFVKHGLSYFYLLNEVTLTFSNKNPKAEVLTLPNQRLAQFRYRGTGVRRHVFDFSLPDYNVEARLHAPTGRTFYQAGIRHPNGMVILKIRVRAPRK